MKFHCRNSLVSAESLDDVTDVCFVKVMCCCFISGSHFWFIQSVLFLQKKIDLFKIATVKDSFKLKSVLCILSAFHVR